MTEQEHALQSAQEECNEVAQRISKALRFGLYEVQPGQEKNNGERIVEEFSQLCAKLALAFGKYNPDQVFITVDPAEYHKTPAKVRKFMEYAQKCGTVTPSLAAYHERAMHALADPGHYTPRGEGYGEALGLWQARAIKIATDITNPSNFPLTGTLSGQPFVSPVKEVPTASLT